MVKLDIVRTQLVSARNMRERSMSTTSLDIREKGKQGMTIMDRSHSVTGTAPVVDLVGDPPPYNHNFHQ